jgi:hypothetical protein
VFRYKVFGVYTQWELLLDQLGFITCLVAYPVVDNDIHPHVTWRVSYGYCGHLRYLSGYTSYVSTVTIIYTNSKYFHNLREQAIQSLNCVHA